MRATNLESVALCHLALVGYAIAAKVGMGSVVADRQAPVSQSPLRHPRQRFQRPRRGRVISPNGCDNRARKRTGRSEGHSGVTLARSSAFLTGGLPWMLGSIPAGSQASMRGASPEHWSRVNTRTAQDS
jgi:hypothetical protein